MAFYKRSTFLINPQFQLKFSLIVCSIIFLSTLVYPVIIFDFFNLFIAQNPNAVQNVVDTQRNLIIFLFVVQVIITTLVFIVFIFLTHKIAGPMFKLKNHLASIREGNPITPLTFRNGDYFADVAEEVSLFLDTVAHNQESDFAYIDEVAAYVQNLNLVTPDDKKPVLNEISRRLIELKSRYNSPV